MFCVIDYLHLAIVKQLNVNLYVPYAHGYDFPMATIECDIWLLFAQDLFTGAIVYLQLLGEKIFFFYL